MRKRWISLLLVFALVLAVWSVCAVAADAQKADEAADETTPAAEEPVAEETPAETASAPDEEADAASEDTEAPAEDSEQNHIHAVNREDSCEEPSFVALPVTGGTLESGCYYLTDDLALEEPLCVPKNGAQVTLCLNGHTLRLADGVEGCILFVAVSDEDIAILKRYGVNVIHNPTSNLKLGSGFAPVRKLMDAGINLALGTDGAASNNNLDMFEEMHLADIMPCGYRHDPTEVSSAEVLDMATVNGARLQGRSDTGVLAVGKKADIIALDLDKPHLYPNFDTPALLTCAAHSSDVVLTMVDGKILYENGTFDVSVVYTTDGLNIKTGLKVLEDDQSFFPDYYGMYIVRGDLLEKYPEVEGILEQLTGKISTQQMTELTYQVDVEGRTVDEVAREFLVSLGLLDA